MLFFIRFKIKIQEILFNMMLSSIFMIYLFKIFLFFVAVLLLFFVINIFQEVPNIFNSEILAFIFFNMRIPLSDCLLFFFLMIIELRIFKELFFVFLLLKLLFHYFLLFFSFHDVFFVFILFQSCPSDGFSETDDWIRYLDWNFTVNIL